MHSRRRALALLGAVAGTLALFASSGPAQDEVEWLDNYAAARSEAARTGKPIFLEFRCEP
jgi:hypothetical protein